MRDQNVAARGGIAERVCLLVKWDEQGDEPDEQRCRHNKLTSVLPLVRCTATNHEVHNANLTDNTAQLRCSEQPKDV